MWATTLKEDLKPLSGPRVFRYAQRRKDWMKVPGEVVQDRQAREAVDSTRAGASGSLHSQLHLRP